MILITFFAFLLLASAVVGGLVFLWNYAAHETTAVWIGLDHQCADNSIAQDQCAFRWIKRTGKVERTVYTHLWNWTAHETTAVFIGLNNKSADNVDGQIVWIETLADATEETERLQKSIMDFYNSLMIIFRPPRKQLSHAQTDVDLEMGLQNTATQTRDLTYKWSLPPISV
eukprot:sb/3472187/